MLETGVVIDGRYRVIEIIGKGGMSTVYLAEHIKLHQKKAVKEIKRDFYNYNELARQRMIGEANILKKLDHPNLPGIVDIMEEKDHILIIMDYVEGKTLKKVLSEYGPLDESRVINIALQLTRVLYYLHSRKPPIIHCDLKPSNLILKEDGTVMLIDFGAAKEFYMEEDREDSICLGTRGYAAPEQYGGIRTDERTDIYCLGVTLYQLLTGKNPAEPPYLIYPIRKWNPYFSPGLETVLEKCTKKDPEKRFQNCLELQYALKYLRENDRGYRQRQTKKVVLFFVLLFNAFLWAGSTAGIHFMKINYKRKAGEAYLKKAERTLNETKASEYYKMALVLQPSYSQIYDSLLKRFVKSEDFGVKDAVFLIDILHSGEETMSVLDIFQKKNPKGYCEFCYSVGLGFFYYLGGAEGKREAEIWFEEVEKTACQGFSGEKRKRAGLYRNISRYYNEFVGKKENLSGEENISGYTELYNDLHQLNQFDINEKSSASDIAVSLLISKEVAIEIAAYAREFLHEEEINSDMLKKELELIMDGQKAEKSRIYYMSLHRKPKEITELIKMVRDAEKKIYLVQKK